MQFLKKLFRAKERSAAFLRRVKAKSYIASNSVLGDWNDPSVMLPEKFKIFDVIAENENSYDKLSLYNKMYYDNIHSFYGLSYEQLLSISDIVDVPSKEFRDVYQYWPNALSMETYKKLYEILQIDFVSEVKIEKTVLPTYIISINIEFWSTTNDSLLKEIALRDNDDYLYQPEKLIHNSYQSAVNYAAIITNQLSWGYEWAEGAFTNKFIEELQKIQVTGKASEKIASLINELETKRFVFYDFRNFLFRGPAGRFYEDEVTCRKTDYDRML